jgi:integrase
VLAFAVADCRVPHNVAAVVRKPTSGRVRREGQALTIEKLRALTEACKGRYRDVAADAGVGWAAPPDAWLFDAPEGGPLRESNWKRSVGWSEAMTAAGVPGFRVHDLRHTVASVWLAAGADPKVVQRVLGHATAAMMMDLYGHMIDADLWQATQLVGDISGTSDPPEGRIRTDSRPREGPKP